MTKIRFSRACPEHALDAWGHLVRADRSLSAVPAGGARLLPRLRGCAHTPYYLGGCAIMLAESSSSLWLLFQRPEGITPLQVWLGVGLVALIWLSTVHLQVPMHLRLERGFDPVVQHSLVTTNWMRTVAWSLRGLLVLWMMAAVAW